MPAFRTKTGAIQQVTLDPEVYTRAQNEGLSLPAYLNRTYGADVDAQKDGSVFTQMCVSEGVLVPLSNNSYDIRAQSIADILDGKAALNFDAATVQQRNSDYGGLQSRILFPVAVVEMIENTLARDRTSEANLFEQMIALRQGIASDMFDQPIINYQTFNGPDGNNRARSQRVAQLAHPPAMATFTTSNQVKRLPTYSIGAEFSKEALRATTLDLAALSLARFFAVEAEGRVYDYMSQLWGGDLDMNQSAIAAVTSNSLDSAASGGTLTHKAWVKWLFRQRRYRRIDYVIGDLDTYMKVEGRTGRPGSIGVLDPTLPKIDPQATAMNPYVDNVKFMIVDSAAEGGPVPANTIWGVDSRYGIVKVTNTAAAYQASVEFAMKKSEAFRIDRSETVYRQFDQAFDVLTIS